MKAKRLKLNSDTSAIPPKIELKDIPTTPYIGLRPFQASDHRIFYGRDRCATFLINKIYSSPLTLFYGRSGLGKSSLLQAKVIPFLEDNATIVVQFDQWSASHPLQALTEHIIEKAESHGAINAGSGGPTLPELIRLLSYVSQKTVVIVLDQFEELLVWHGEEIDSTAEALACLLRSNLDLHIVFSMREEYLATLEPLRNYIPSLFHTTYRIEPLNIDGLYAALSKPLHYFNAHIDQDLFWRLIEDLKSSTDEKTSTFLPSTDSRNIELPILQLICCQLWKEATKNQPIKIDLQLYEKLGGYRQILRHYVSTISPKGYFHKRITADLLHILAPASGLKMSFSADDLVNLSNLRLSKNTINQELIRLHDCKILRTKKFHGEERFELLHDAYIDILLPWALNIRERTRKMKKRATYLAILATMILFSGSILQRRDSAFWQEYAESMESRLVDSEDSLSQSIEHSTRLSNILNSLESQSTSDQLVIELQNEIDRFKTNAIDNASNTTREIEKTASILGKPTLPPIIRIAIEDNSVVISGKMSDEKLLVGLKEIFGENRLDIQNSHISSTISHPEWMNEIIPNLSILKSLIPPANINIANRKISLSGTAPNTIIRRKLIDLFSSNLAKDWTLENNIYIPPSLIFSRKNGVIALTGLLPTDSAEKITQTASNYFDPSQMTISPDNKVEHSPILDHSDQLISIFQHLTGDAFFSLDERTLTLSGTAEDHLNKTQIENIVKSIIPADWKLIQNLTVLPSISYTKSEAGLTIYGELPELSSFLNIHLQGLLTFGPDKLNNYVITNHSVQNTDYLSVLSLPIKQINDLQHPAKIQLSGHQAMVQGIAPDIPARTGIFHTMHNYLPGRIQINNDIKAAPSMSITINDDQIHISGYVANTTQKNDIMTIVNSLFTKKLTTDIQINPYISEHSELKPILNILKPKAYQTLVKSINYSRRNLVIEGHSDDYKEYQQFNQFIQKQIPNTISATNKISVSPAFNISVNDYSIHLRGDLSNQTEGTSFAEILAGTFPNKHFSSHHNSNPAIQNTDLLERVRELIPLTQQVLPPFTLALSQNHVFLSGTVLNENLKQSICTTINRKLRATQGQFTCGLTIPTLISFEHDSDILTPPAKRLLENTYVKLLSKYETIEIGGHTDSTGNTHRNLILSQQRAERVKEFLISKGLSINSLTTAGYSDNYPLICTPYRNKRIPENRRIEFYINGQLPRPSCRN